MEYMEEINKQGVSIIIGARNEFPQIVLTVTNIINDLELSGITKYEMIIADNGSTDETSTFWGYRHSNTSPSGLEVAQRGLLSEGILKIIYDPVLSNVGARTKAVKTAKYENIIFADAHMIVSPYATKYTLETLNKFGGIVHAPVAWAGASVKHPHPGIQYTVKIGEKWWNTWNYAVVNNKKPFYVPGGGHCWLGVKKEEFTRFRGYHTAFRVYGGGEPYLDLKWWLLGSNVMVDPRITIYHLSAGRGYFWDQADLIHNQMLCSYTTAGEKWSERLLIAYLNKPGTDHDYIKKLYSEALTEGKEDREWILGNQKFDINTILGLVGDPECTKKDCKHPHVLRIWDIKNEKLHKNHLSYVALFDDWLQRLTDPEAKEFYTKSPNQKS